ncbi:helix-turn-helix domain-containing protein [Oceanobacillus saliphilus]|uniref:helix-turn-helix domain-containing protein n=1 Tax=Oceanobacillus saliphilus TaxID=2925834 RepID=UPI00201E6A1E|nr:helix-turn-helix domain-containing protein [Oceanobacillus saliphilus]
MIFDGIILTCVSNLNGERTASSIYHLVKGKKSIQTIQDAHIYQLDKFYGIHSHLTKERFNKNLSALVTAGLLKPVGTKDGVFQLTTHAVNWLDNHREQLKIDYFHGLTYNGTANSFFLRLLLLIQTLTNTKMDHYHFIPVTDNYHVERWVKQVYRKINNNQEKALESLYIELYSILKKLPDKDASVFVDRLTGYQNYGLSTNQLSDKYNLSADDVHLILTGVIHYLLSTIQEKEGNYPILSYIVKDLDKAVQITHSASITSELLSKNYTIEQISAMRNLKINTIYDHIVELALYEANFQVDEYISQEEQEEVLTVLNNVNSYKLKDIKNSVNTNISYFQIRLVLAVNKKLLSQGD